ncbi:hypothetical protein [Mangrovibacillus cuniculi]|uniref:Uncharacterized protein n=1 Tax=Mangrovibacillus cuniculi TaxID=2593652 RepID=A0A7S8CAY2_9BACI|nr:hypothetical protein [Mangrovibacillus cuniculi]QPC46511.1 hypothetical protein G8O30_05790 [Mangrovibacillus cuniculi]
MSILTLSIIVFIIVTLQYVGILFKKDTNKQNKKLALTLYLFTIIGIVGVNLYYA